MKKTFAIILALTLCLMTFTAFAQSPTEAELVGSWKGEWVYNDNQVLLVFTLYSDGHYSLLSVMNNEYNYAEGGIWEISGNAALLLNGDDNSWRTLDYSNGTLVDHGKYTFTKW